METESTEKGNTLIAWHCEFARVIGCTRCTKKSTDPYLLRDRWENVPQPGLIGANYTQHRVLFVGQNPGTPGTEEVRKADRSYTKALGELRDEPTPERYDELHTTLREFMQNWSLLWHIPLEELKFSLDNIAYLNLGAEGEYVFA